jgi:SAM-dependent methyltransferase
MATATLPLAPTAGELSYVFQTRYGPLHNLGPVPKLWHRLKYFAPDDYYEALVAKLIGAGSAWLDVGCGREVFPGNSELARELARKCGQFVGVDPDATIEENPIVVERVRCPIEEYTTERQFDVITLRMVAEHITRPELTLSALTRLTRPGGRVVVFTVNRWSPVPLATRLLPFRLHHAVKSLLWGTEEKDTFPVAYRMNTRTRLRRLFGEHGFRETYFARPADCRVFFRWRPLHRLELALWQALTAAGLTYPENCLLGAYERA